MYAPPPPSEMFSDAATGTQVAEQFEKYKTTLADVHKRATDSPRAFVPGQGLVAQAPSAETMDVLAKAAGIMAGVDSSVKAELDRVKDVIADIGKDWSLTSPNSTGFVPYDLEAPAKLLVPRQTPLRNSIPRGKGVGTARQFKRITGWSNSGTGGVADQMAFMNSDTASETFGALNLRRGKKIAYASDTKNVAYVELGLSDQVNWKAQFAGQGFQDIRSLSQTGLLWAHMGAEERALLLGRGASGNGYAGAVSAPTVTAAAAGTDGTIPAATYGVKVSSVAGGGESIVATASAGLAVSATNHVTITFTGGAEPAGALAYNVYMGPAASETYQGTFTPITSGGATTITLTSYKTGGAAFTAADTTFNANGYDGFLTVQSDPAQSGYLKRVNAALTSDSVFQDAFAAMYGAGVASGNIGNPAVLAGNKTLADPDEVWVDGNVRRKLGDYLKGSGSSSYRLALTEGDAAGGATVGAVVNGLANQVTGRMVDLAVHPYMPPGAAFIRSRTLPVPESEVSATSQVINVQDYMAVEWPVIQYTYDQSTYQYGTLVHYAPAWSGLLLGLQ